MCCLFPSLRSVFQQLLSFYSCYFFFFASCFSSANHNSAFNVHGIWLAVLHNNPISIQLLFVEAVGWVVVAHVLTFCATVAANKQVTRNKQQQQHFRELNQIITNFSKLLEDTIWVLKSWQRRHIANLRRKNEENEATAREKLITGRKLNGMHSTHLMEIKAWEICANAKKKQEAFDALEHFEQWS